MPDTAKYHGVVISRQLPQPRRAQKIQYSRGTQIEEWTVPALGPASESFPERRLEAAMLTEVQQ